MTAPARTAEVGRPSPLDLGLIGVAVLAVGTSGPLIAATAAPALAVAAWRNLFASGLLVPVALVRRRRELAALGRREWGLMLGAGVLLAVHFATWVPSLRYTTVATSTALVALQPVWAGLMARAAGRYMSPRAWVGIGLAVAGAVLLTGVDLRTDSRAVVGDLLALVGGMFSAAYMTTGSAVRRTVSTTVYTAVCYTTCGLLLVVVCLVGRQPLYGYDASDWWKLAGLTLGAQLLGHSLFNRVLQTTSATVVSLSILFEIPGAALIAAVFLHQVPPWSAAPAAVLLLAGIAVTVTSSPETQSAPAE